MPLKNGNLTPPERVFSQQYAATGDALYAAKQAGYGSPQPRSSELLRKPAIQAEIAAIEKEKLFSEILPIAVRRHKEALLDVKTPPGALTQLIKLAYDRTLGSEDAGGGKEPHEMSPEELAKAIDALERVAAERAKLVAVEPIDEAEPLDILG